MSLPVTVHHFTLDPSLASPSRLLESARCLVDSAIATSQWRSVVPKDAFGVLASSNGFSGSCFVWSRPLPAINRSAFRSSHESELQDWDAPFENSQERLDIRLLPEFETSDFGDIILKSPVSRRRSRAGSSSTRYFADDVDVNLDKQLSKRLCTQPHPLPTELTPISISKFIPFPHYHESPDPARPPPSEIERIPAFRIVRSLSPSPSLTIPFSRLAWFVPLRGTPPIEGASPAQLYSTIREEPSPEGAQPRLIQWTSTAVTQFWEFLLRQRKMNNFGPIAFAYMFSPRSLRGGQHKSRGSRRYTNAGEMTSKQKRDHLTKVAIPEEELGTAWEYIKIYHDSQYAMKLRSLLDSFRCEEDLNDTRGGTHGDVLPLRYRVLKLARLLLVDETGQAVLIS